ncbi:MAG: hypothetical protein PVI30_17075 [Myxococcales bacterium]|jgi:hypothetical protein
MPERAESRAESRAEEPFAALLRAAVDDAQAAQGLALAYAALPRAQREELVDAVVDDAHDEGICASQVLASLLSVEDDAHVARRIASCISAAGGAGLATREPCRAMLAGDEAEGSLLLTRPLHGNFAEVLGLSWRRGEGIVYSFFEPLVRTDDAPGSAERLRHADALEEAPPAFAVDVVTPVLWSHRRRHGDLPEVVAHFADLFEPDTPPDA